MYLVHFLRKDGKPIEEYCYYALEEAQEHFEMFREDDSGLYERILIFEEGREEIMIDSISFVPGRWSRLRLGYLQEYRQDEYERLKDEGALTEHLATIELSAQQMFEATMEELKELGIEMSQASISMFAEEHTLEQIVFR